MAITQGGLIPVGGRVRIRRGAAPLDPDIVGRTGTVIDATPYRAHSYGVVLDGERDTRMFAADELEELEELTLPPDREQAKRWRALP